MELYKYLKPERSEIVENLMIKFSQPNDFNDPFESLPFISSIMSIDSADKFYRENYEEVINPRIEAFKNKRFLECLPKEDLAKFPQPLMEYLNNLTMDNARAIHNINIESFFESGVKSLLAQYPESIPKSLSDTIKETWNEQFGILCLSERQDNLIMWAHYAQNHEGFVLGFNRDSIFFDQRKSKNDVIRQLKKVQYKEERPEIALYDTELDEFKLNEFLIENILLTKSKHWSSEEEWRIIFYLKEADQTIKNEFGQSYLFKIPESLITSLYLGVRISNENKSRILATISKKGVRIPVYQGVLNKKKYLLDFVKIN
jgi:hypothetical protein